MYFPQFCKVNYFLKTKELNEFFIMAFCAFCLEIDRLPWLAK